MIGTPPSEGVVRAFLRALRPHQWVKNLFVLAPLVFARDIFDPERLKSGLGAFGFFCLISGAVYLLNDICDLQADRVHPVKRHRPIASGALPVSAAVWGQILLVTGSVLGGWLWLGPAYGLVAGGYFLVNTLYSLKVKHVAYVDVVLIALGFVLRVVAGGVAIDVPISRWLLVCTFLLALYLGFGKRLHELSGLGARSKVGRRSLLGYEQGKLVGSMNAVGLLTGLAYMAYTLDPVTVAKFQTRWLAVTTPFILFGLVRFGALVRRDASSESPTDRMIRDLPFLLNLAIWGALVMAILYV